MFTHKQSGKASQLLLTLCFGTGTRTKRTPESRLACAFFFKHRDYFPSSRSFVRTCLCTLHPYLDASLHLMEALSIERWVLGCNIERLMHLFSWVGEVQLDLRMVQCMSVRHRPTKFSYIGNEGCSRSIIGGGAHLSSHDLQN